MAEPGTTALARRARPRLTAAVLARHLRPRWTWAAHLLLVVLGVANVYPFLWVIGTSLKSRGEASTDRGVPLPAAKYRVATPPPAVLPAALDERALRLLHGLRGGDPPVTAPAYAERFSRTLEHARSDLARLAAAGLLRPAAAEAAPPAGAADIAYALGPAGEALPRLAIDQLILIADMQQVDAVRRESATVSEPDARTLADYRRLFPREAPDDATALARLDELVAAGWLAPSRLMPVSYAVVWTEREFAVHFATSLVTALTVVFLVVLSTSMMGYALARLRFAGKAWVIALLVAGMVAPHEGTIVPIFRLLHSLGLFEGLWGMVLWLCGVGIGNAFLMAGYFSTLPKEVEEAAVVDGAGRFRLFFDIALPMARPIVATVGLLAFLGAWNSFMVPFLCTMSRPSMQPLSVAVYTFQQGWTGYWNLTTAAAAIMVVPVIGMFVIFSRQIVQSIAAGAVKG